jgi:hypothetical protein
MKTLKVVSVSLGASDRDHEAQIELLGKKIHIRRIGSDGDVQKARRLTASLDGRVDAMGLGGIDFYLSIKGDKYALPDAFKIAGAAKKTPMVDGSGLKNSVEDKIAGLLIKELKINPAAANVFFVCATNRAMMAESFENAGFNMIFGDLMTSAGLPIPIKSLNAGRIAAAIFAPIVTKLLPYSFIYPVTKDDGGHREKFGDYFRWADIIAGDFNYIKRRAPLYLGGKIIVTTSVTKENAEDLKRRKVSYLVTTYPRIEGRAFGANVIEALLIAVSGRNRALYPGEYLELINKIKFTAEIEKLN